MADKPADTYIPATQNRNATSPGILILTANNTEDLEFFYPYYRFIEAGYRVDVATPDGGKFEAKHGLGISETRKTMDVKSGDYAMLYIPGGKAPEQLKKDKFSIELARAFVRENKPVAAICHGPQLLAAAGVIKGKKIAAWPEVEKEVQQAGATYVNEETVTDGLFTTARWPADLPMHMKVIFKILNANPHVENRNLFAAA